MIFSVIIYVIIEVFAREIKLKGVIMIGQNKFNLDGEYGIGYTSKGEEFYFDLEDYDKIKDYTWYITRKGYVSTTDKITHKKFFMHNLVMNTPPQNLDHENRKRNDNRKFNLRFTTFSQNASNITRRKDNTSGVTGVTFHQNKWQARIQVNEKRISLGCYDNKDDAIKARLLGEIKYFGEFAPQKHLFEKYNIED
jgi:hypothetical protein